MSGGWSFERPPVDPGVTLLAGMLPLPDKPRPVLLFLLGPGQDEFYTGEFLAAGMRWLQQSYELNGLLLPRANGVVTATGPLPRKGRRLLPGRAPAEVTYGLTSVAIRSGLSRAQFPFGQPFPVSEAWIESAGPEGAVVALGPASLAAHADRATPEDLVALLQEAAGQARLVAGLLPLTLTGP
ncbi:MAG TPA: hypothetical protein VIL36_10425 [Acidimicrobiales bacterium]